jgi:hypothetical protein
MEMAVVCSFRTHQTTQCHNPDDMGSGVLGCGAVLFGAVLFGEHFLMFHRNTVPSSSTVKQPKETGLHLLGLLDR